MEAVIFVGIQASGKSTFFQQRFFATYMRVSLDLLRTRHRERALVTWCIEHQQRFVVDNTNPTIAERTVYIAPARAAGFRMVGLVFESHVPTSITRNATRTGAARVPDVAIGDTRKRLEHPSLAEGFDELHFVRLDGQGGFVVEEWRDAV